MLLCELIDLDLEDPVEVYENATETVAYLSNVIATIEKRVENGEIQDGFKIVEGRKTREITKEGIAYLETIIGEKVYEKKPIGITALERHLSLDDIDALLEQGYIIYKIGKPKVMLDKEEK